MLPPSRPPRVLVVVPAYNEQPCVGDVVREIRSAVPDADIVVVDDGSRDRTADEARRAGAGVLALPFNLGVGGAMRTGFLYADRHGYDAVVQVDADGQHDPSHVPLLVEALRRCNVVVGARFAGVGSYRVRGPRRWAMRLLSVALSRSAGTNLTDTTSGFRAVDRPAIRLFARYYPAEYLGDTVESLVMAVRAGLVVRQVPVKMRLRAAGSPSQSPLKASLFLGRAMLALMLAYVRTRHEVAVDLASEEVLP